MTRYQRLLLAGALLAAGGCTKETICATDQALCGGHCTAVATDAGNCGACGAPCAAGESCSGGFCRCGDGRADCGGACVDVASDPSSCGACGAACAAPLAFCQAAAGLPSGAPAACAASCDAPGGFTACGNACVRLDADRWNCGACGRACGTNERCERGLCFADLYLACSNTAEVREATSGLEPAGVPHAVGDRPVSLAWMDDSLFVANSIGNSISEVRFDLPAPAPVGVVRTLGLGTPGYPVAYPDLEYLAERNGLFFVSDAATDALLVVDPAPSAGEVVQVVPLRETGDPYWIGVAGIAFAGGKAYVALEGAGAIAVVDVSGCQPGAPACDQGTCADPGASCVNGRCQPASCGQILRRVALPASLATGTGSPAPYRLLAAGSLLYVTLQNLDLVHFTPAGSGRLTAVDTIRDALVESPLGTPLAVDLGGGCLNPGGLAILGETLWVACGFLDWVMSTVSGAALVPVSLAGTLPAVGTAVPLGPAAGQLVSCGGAIYAGAISSGDVMRYDPAGGTLSTASLCPPRTAGGDSYVADLACAP